jgi:uncharacterized protein (TIGR03546 family)
MYSQLAQLLKILNSDASVNQISMAIVFALFVGLTPLLSLHCVLVFLIVCVTRVNLSVFFLALAGFSLVSLIINPLLVQIGESLLLESSLNAMWTALYQIDVFRLLRINHTLVLGGFSLALALSVPMFYLSRYLVNRYRQELMVWVNNLRLVKLLKTTNFFQDYLKLGA